jgi:hypothetical protein
MDMSGLRQVNQWAGTLRGEVPRKDGVRKQHKPSRMMPGEFFERIMKHYSVDNM